MCSEPAFDDPLGFSRETAALITGLGCSNLKQFRKRNISLDDLQYLTSDDLKILEVGDEFDFAAFDKLSATLRRKRNIRIDPKISHVVNIVQNSQKQLRLLYLYLKVVSKQLQSNKTDVIIERNKNIRASQGIIIGCNSVLVELNNFKEALEKLKPEKSKSTSNRRVKSFIGLGLGAGLSLAIIYYKFLR